MLWIFWQKKGITISSTEDKIEISSPKEIVITGASSQITLNGSGILAKTGGKFEVNAGQHLFKPASSAKQVCTTSCFKSDERGLRTA